MPPPVASTPWAIVTSHWVPPWSAVLPFVALWYAVEWGLCRIAGWPAGGRDLAAMGLRDVLLQPLWCATWARKGFEWRGTAMDAVK